MNTPNAEAQVMATVFFPAPTMSKFYAEIQRTMSEPWRFYHTPRHLTRMYDELRASGIWEDIPSDINVKGLVLAISCHDLIQDHSRSNNEEQSAEYMVHLMGIYKEETTFIHAHDVEDARRLIMATKHDGRELSRYDERLIHDLDLTILGSEPETFEIYERQIRQEYSHVPDKEYLAGRIDILNRLNIAPIFKTSNFYQKYEEAAHRNIEQLIQRLSQS